MRRHLAEYLQPAEILLFPEIILGKNNRVLKRVCFMSLFALDSSGSLCGGVAHSVILSFQIAHLQKI